MIVSPRVAYRTYTLKNSTKAIAFNIDTQHFMFLDGLSAELFHLLTDDSDTDILSWLEQNEISPSDFEQFKSSLTAFGLYGSDQQQLITSNNDDLDTNSSEHSNELNLFQNELRRNNLFYCFHIDLTNRCNEKCIHCYHPFDKYDHSKELSTTEIFSLIDTLYDLGVFVVTLSGGECLLRKDFFEILSYISSKGMLSMVFTNGILLTESVVQQLSKYRVKIVSISIYGDTEDVHDAITQIPGSFKRTLSGIDLLKKYRIPFELKCVVLAENIERVEKIRQLSMNLNYGKDCKIDFSLCGKVDGDCSNFSHQASCQSIKQVFFANPERYFDIDNLSKRYPNDSPCGAGKYGLYCSAEGDIYPCVSFRLQLCSYKELRDIHQNTILNKWLSTKISDFSDCFQHDYCNFCTEQCAGNNFIENGNYLDSRNISNCERAKIIAEWFKLYGNDKRKEVSSK